MNMCDICKKTFKNLKYHQWRVHTSDGIYVGKKISIANKGKPTWNKGLTKEMDFRLAKMSNTINTNLKNGNRIIRGHPHTEKTKMLLRKHQLDCIKRGKNIVCGRTKKYKYISPIAGEMIVDGTWELKFAMWCDANKIPFKRNRIGFKYVYTDGLEHIYFPDFQLTDTLFVEVKGYETEKDRIKWKQFPYNLIVLRKKEILNLEFLTEDLLYSYSVTKSTIVL